MALIPMVQHEREAVNAHKLRLILAGAQQKAARGIPLSPKEENLIAELDRQRLLKPRETVSVDDDGNIVIQKAVDAEPIMEAMKAYGDFIDKYSSHKRAQRMVGSIDPITAYNWMRESGAKIGTREFAQFAMKRIKNDIDFRAFRVGG